MEMIEKYLEQLREELAKANADPALIQDAVYDAEEYLRNEISAVEGEDAEAAFEYVVKSYGTPEEVANSYLEAELTVVQAMRSPVPLQGKSALSRFFGVLVDPQTYGAFFYLLLSLATGVAYFTIAVTGVSLSLSMSILIIGIPVILLFLALVRSVSFIEGRLVEGLLGVRMPRRPRVVTRQGKIIERVKWWLKDRRTWTTLLYMLVQLPLGTAYFSGVVTAFSLCLAAIAAPVLQVVYDIPIAQSSGYVYYLEWWAMPIAIVLGALSIVILMHAVRGIGKLHGVYAKSMLVGSIEEMESK